MLEINLKQGTKMKGARQMQATAVRLPDEFMDWLRQQAAGNKRSLAGEIYHRLELTRQQDALHRHTKMKGQQP